MLGIDSRLSNKNNRIFRRKIMFVYQTGKNGDIVNVVKGAHQIPKSVPDFQVGFVDDKPFVKVGGVSFPVVSTSGAVAFPNEITLNGVKMEVPNPDLVITLEDDQYNVGGTMAVAPDAVCRAWGYEVGSHLFTTRVTFDGEIDDTFTGTCDGKVPNKPILYSKFDGPNYIDYIFSGETKKIVIKYKANKDAEEKIITINNNATLAE